VLEVYPRSETILDDEETGIHLGFRITADDATTSPLNSDFVLDFDSGSPFGLGLVPGSPLD